MSRHLNLSRRELFQNAAGGFAMIALAGMLAEQDAAGATNADDPLAPKKPHFPARAKRVIFIYMNGGVSHVDSFDPKPELFANHGKTITVDNWQGKLGQFKRYLKRPGWKFQPGGQCGTEVSDLFPNIRSIVDDLCVIRSVESNHTNHYEASLGMHTGSWTFARPSVGAWVSYGLGTENRNLPSFMVLAPVAPYAGAQTWGSDFLPGCHQGTQVIPGPTPIPNVERRVASTELQRLELDLIARANRRHMEERPGEAALEARVRSFETAFGMQQDAPEAFDFSKETTETLKLYGLSRGANRGFAWQCLAARRLAERGVRFVEVIHDGNWDSHGDMGDHGRLAPQVDQPIAGLVTDLKRHGMLKDTLVVWTTEFGRTPYHEQAEHKGREHHHQVFSSWIAGGGAKAGIAHGSSDEHGIAVASDRVHVHDFHATILHLLGLDHERLTYRHAGRDYRLTDVAGKVVSKIIA
jgi:hypothetical protein